MYADDLVLMLQTKEGLPKHLDRLFEYCQKRKLVVNTDKTKIMVFNKSGKMLKNCRFTYSSDIIEMVQECKYLGIKIRVSGVVTRGVADLSNKALKVMFMLRQKFQTSYIYPELHFRLFDTCVKPIILYCYEVWNQHIINVEKHLGKDSTYKLEELYEDFIPEKVQTKLCKYIIGANKYTTNISAKCVKLVVSPSN